MYSFATRFLCWTSLLLMLPVAIASCDTPSGPKEERRIGVIAFLGNPVAITMPDTVLVGESFSASVRTYGDGCISQDDTEVESAGLSIDITPYDVHSGSRVCTSILNMFDHTVALTVTQPGTAQILFHGKRLPGDVPITEVREVVVK